MPQRRHSAGPVSFAHGSPPPGSGKERIIFTLIQKFNSATKLPECVNTSPDIIVLIDEGHRSQGGENHVRMKLALPNAAFVAFTG
ncbi:DEAD/DEAH box helicase family protein, partial [Escherichia coli]|uniref:DEAD/DEAH box helicase family protein n=1 Tax=Escherichia coli TaxID=562 RepID=UPI003D8157E9